MCPWAKAPPSLRILKRAMGIVKVQFRKVLDFCIYLLIALKNFTLPPPSLLRITLTICFLPFHFTVTSCSYIWPSVDLYNLYRI